MAQFKTIVEAVLRNSTGGEIDRVEIVMVPVGNLSVPRGVVEWFSTIEIGDTITIEERETEVV